MDSPKIYTEGDVRAISLMGYIRGVEIGGINPTERQEVLLEFADHKEQLAEKPAEMEKFKDRLRGNAERKGLDADTYKQLFGNAPL